MTRTNDPTSPLPAEALRRLVEGNRRFLGSQATAGGRTFDAELAARPQRPFAIVLGCSDARTPVEILFDQGLGDLFVVRIAGNIVAPSVVGSIEFAASHFGTRLVVVLGHTHCGAIEATVHALRTGLGPDSRNIRSITDRIAPHIGGVVERHPLDGDPARLHRDAMRANVQASVDHLRHGSRLLEELVLSGRVLVLGGEYEIETGAVRFFEPVPDR